MLVAVTDTQRKAGVWVQEVRSSCPHPHGDSLRVISRFYPWGIWVLLVLVKVTFDYNWKDPFT